MNDVTYYSTFGIIDHWMAAIHARLKKIVYLFLIMALIIFEFGQRKVVLVLLNLIFD
jgi:hypothetical protein